MNLPADQVDQLNAMFLITSGDKLNEMAQATMDSGFLQDQCTFDELKALFKERGLGENNVLNFLRYAESVASQPE